MLSVLEKVNGSSILDGTGVSEDDVRNAVVDFSLWADENGGRKDLLCFFDEKRRMVARRTLKMLALIGIKYMLDEYASLIRSGNDKKDNADSDT